MVSSRDMWALINQSTEIYVILHYFIPSILTTAEYCVETMQQLEEKLKEKLGNLAPKLSMESEKSSFLEIIDTCVSLLVQDLDSTCEPLLASITKVRDKEMW